MKKQLIIVSALALLMTGCATDLSSAFNTITDAAIAGALTYEQIAALKAAAKAERDSTEAPEPGIVDPADCPPGTPPPPPVPQKPVVPISGMASMVILGADTCSKTRTFLALKPEEAVESLFPWVDVVYADRASNSAVYQKYRPVEGFSFPLVRFFNAQGVFISEYVGRKVTIQDVIERARQALPKPTE